MKKFYLTFFSVLFLMGPQIFAQESQMPYPRKPADKATPSIVNPNNTSEGLPFRARPDQKRSSVQNVVPVQEQIHTPIRWYALENVDNPNYWQNVNTERIWLELEVGASLTDTDIAEFLESFGLQEVVKRSMHPHLTKFFVFEKPGNTPTDVIEMARAAKNVAGILFLEPSVIYTGQVVPNDPMWSLQWGPYTVFADEAWDYGFGGDSWNVMAVLDDAIDWLHEDQYNQVWYGYDYGFNDGDPTLDAAEQTHGTHVTGIMSATTNNGIGVAGMCNDTVFFAKVTDNTYFTQNGAYSDAAIINAIYDIAQNIARVTVINLSLGGGAPSAAAEQAYTLAWNNDKLPIAASGNEGNSSISYPAAYSACMAVGSIGTNGGELYLTQYSNYGEAQEISAPGGDVNTGFGIISSVPENGYEALQGTSMACPMVAGLAGLMKSLNPDLTAFEIRNIINATAFDLGTEGWDINYGYGMINAKLAVEVALGQSSSVGENISSSLKIYPNPASERLWIENFQGIQKGQIEIFDMKGQLMQFETLTPNELIPINIQNLPEGVYVVKLNSGDQLFTGRFVKTN